MANALQSSTRFEMEPEQLLSVLEEMDKRGWGPDPLGIFHSHPDHPTTPSDFDLKNAIPWYSYLITSVVKGIAAESRSWRLSDDRSGFLPEEIKVG